MNISSQSRRASAMTAGVFGVAGAFGLGLPGCTVGPDYRGPPETAVINAPAARGPFVSGAGPAFSSEPAEDAWWRLYDSTALDALVNEAFAANTDLRMAQANLERSKALLREARAARQPTATLNFDPSYEQLSAESFLLSRSLPALGLYDTGISVSYEVDLFGGIRRAIEAATANDEAVRAAYDMTRVVVAAETARAYADVCSASEELEVTRRALALQMQSSQVTQRLVSAGRAPILDSTRSEGEVAQTRADIPVLESQRTNALYRLAALTAHPPAEYPRVADSCSSALRLERPIPVGDGAALLRRRPDVRAAERQLAAATARIGVATAELYPRVTLGIAAGSTGSLSDFMTAPTNRYGAAVGIQWEANQTAARARIAQANAETQRLLARFDGVVLAALREIESALSAYGHNLRREEDLVAAQARASEAQLQSQRLYEGGKLDFLPFLDAQRTLTAADRAVAVAHAQIASDQVAIFLALGGGWESAGGP